MGAGRARLLRHSRSARWFHAAVYLLTAIELATGWWLLSGREGRPSPLAAAASTGDVALHVAAGLALLGLGVVGATAGRRAARTLLAQSWSFRRSEWGWLAAWPRALASGRFGRHEGLFDPGQRVANIVMAGGLTLLAASGAGLVAVSGGDAFVLLLWVHKAATFVVTPVIAGHVLVASGVLPGYRGVWRAMHLGGEIDLEVAQRLWPAWSERKQRGTGSHEPGRPAAGG